MSITLKLTFPAGRYHATPWGRHVNEGVPEWPPSPWRLLRALIAIWRRTCPDLSTDRVRQTLEQLLGPPDYYLPPYRVAHTRHYMPWEKKGPLDRTLVLDTFVSLPREQPVFIHWPNADSSSQAKSTLESLLPNLPSLGRAESWVEAELTDETRDWNCKPAELEATPLPVFCPDPTSALQSDHFPRNDAKALKRGLKPADLLFDCPPWHLCLDTQIIHARRWPTVPGARWLNYTRPPEFVLSAGYKQPSSRARPTVARFVLDGPVLPLVTETIRVAEGFRRAAMFHFQRCCERKPAEAASFLRSNALTVENRIQYSSKVLSGKDTEGRILATREHAYYMPTAEGVGNRRITHITVFAPAGFNESEIAALSSIRWLRKKEDRLHLQIVGLGCEPQFHIPLFGTGKEWKSMSPYLGPEHVGLRGQGRYMRKAIRREWRRLASQVPQWQGITLDQISELSAEDVQRSGKPRALEFRRARSKYGETYRACGFYRVVFSRPIAGPLCLGYGSHFGMGTFVPESIE